MMLYVQPNLIKIYIFFIYEEHQICIQEHNLKPYIKETTSFFFIYMFYNQF